MCEKSNRLFSKGVGNATVRVAELDNPVTIGNLTHAPELSVNLLSVSMHVKKKMVVVFSGRGCEIFRTKKCRIQGKPIVSARQEKGNYKRNQIQKRDTAFAVINRKQSLWHRRMEHLWYINVKLLRDKMAVGIYFQDEGPP